MMSRLISLEDIRLDFRNASGSFSTSFWSSRLIAGFLSPAAGWYSGNRIRSSHSSILPWSSEILPFGLNLSMETRPSVTTIFGSISSIWRSKYGRHAATSLGSGSRLSGGRHFTTLVMNTSSRVSGIAASSSSSNLPERPTNGRPCLSSLNPGPSPMIRISALDDPLPGTPLVLVEWRPQLVHERTALASA